MNKRQVIGTITGTAGVIATVGGEAIKDLAREVAPKYAQKFVTDSVLPNVTMVPNNIYQTSLEQVGSQQTFLAIFVSNIAGSINAASNGTVNTFVELLTTQANTLTGQSTPIADKLVVLGVGNSTQISMGGGEVVKVAVQSAQPGYQTTLSLSLGHLKDVLVNAPAVHFAHHVGALGGDAVIVGAAALVVTIGLFGKDIMRKILPQKRE
ncbi:MAG: hypothetical protein KGI04_02245 [Candidatus Micrarchaeota archaeon]|nr:hypothetical protein [Candidatus Micrarchaeota archaeon]